MLEEKGRELQERQVKGAQKPEGRTASKAGLNKNST